LETTNLTTAWLAWDRWCRNKAKRPRGNEGRAESARLVSELVHIADQLGTSHAKLRDAITTEIGSGTSIPDAIERVVQATM